LVASNLLDLSGGTQILERLRRIAALAELEEGLEVELLCPSRLAEVELHPRPKVRIELPQNRNPHVDRASVENEERVTEVVRARLRADDLVQRGHVEREPAPARRRSKHTVAREREIAAPELERRRRVDPEALQGRGLRRSVGHRRRVDARAAAGDRS